MFILSFISSDLEFWSVDHTLIYENTKLKGFQNITKGAFTYYVITKRGGRSPICLCMIMREGGGWSYDDISK